MGVLGTVFDVKRFTVHDGPGIRTTVFLKGCPLDCVWCHNPESRDSAPEPSRGLSPRMPGMQGLQSEAGIIGRLVDSDSVLDVVLLDRLFFDESGGGLTISGGEPLFQSAFAANILASARREGIRTAVDTSGAVPWTAFEESMPFTDLYLYDIKVMRQEDHEKWVGKSLSQIHDNLRRLVSAGAQVRLRIPLIPGITDTAENLEAVAALAASLPSLEGVDLLPYNAAGEHKYDRLGLPLRAGPHIAQSPLALKEAQALFEGTRIPVSIGGSP